MANLNEIIANALRLGPASREKLSDEIERNIRTARAEMIRLGVPDSVATSQHDLIVDAIVTFCLMKMGDSSRTEQFREGWEFQVECIRKSKIVLDGE